MNLKVNDSETDYVIIGSGIAGLRAAVELAEAGRVTILTKSKPDESNTEYAQGGVAVALSDEDEIELHYNDTITAGDGLCNEEAVKVLVEEGPIRITELIEWGTEFDREGVKLAFSREGAHSRKRVLHARGDSTGREIIRSLLKKVNSFPNVKFFSHCFSIDLIVENSYCRGVIALNKRAGTLDRWNGKAVLLATGGLGHVYRDTTNPDIATGDGFAMAYRAGADLTDMEFVQFHPTALALPGAPRFLLSEAMRGEGGYLRNVKGERFMARYHTQKELAPRDVVSRAIVQEINDTNSRHVFLDMTHLDPSFVRNRFPKIYQTCLTYGVDITRDLIPIHPAAHYMMGGVKTDLNGRSSVGNLYAAGEVACTGVHGANRLASNSLLEGLVYGTRAGKAMATTRYAFVRADNASLPIDMAGLKNPKERQAYQEEREAVQKVMRNHVGMIRSKEGLSAALQILDGCKTSENVETLDQFAIENSNILTVSKLIAKSALIRTESRGAHHRSDFPQRDDARWKKHIVVQKSVSSFKLQV